MISTNTTSSNSTQKLKTSKSSRDVIQNNFELHASVEEGNEAGADLVYDNGRNYTRDGRFRSSVGRSRSTEFRSSRITDRRNTFRGRGNGTSSRRDERDYNDFHGKKYDAVRNSDNLGNYRNKFYESEKKVELKLNLPEDTRISKLLRRLNNETNQENSLAICKKLLEVLLFPDNALYVRKAFHILGDSMYDILHVSPGPMAKSQASRALGRMGYIMAQEDDFDRYQSWLFSKMNKSCDEIQILLMKSFTETFELEAKKPQLRNYADLLDNLIGNLVGAIETTENAEVFKAILETLVTVVELYPQAFNDQFRDTIDLLFGWHVDHTQPLYNIEFISKSLLRISHHFKYNLEFSVNLIENFLEDIMNYSSQLNDPNETSSIEHVTVLILALNTVLKCLGTTFHPNHNKFIKSNFITNCFTHIIQTCTEALESYVPDNLIIASNDCISFLFSVMDNKTQNLCTQVLNLIDLELSILNDLSEAAIVSILLFISKVIKELSVNLPIELIEKLIGPSSEITKLRSSTFRTIKDSVICVYQALLNLKNVSLLQEAYRYVLGDLEVVYRKLMPNIEPFVQNNPFLEYNYENEPPELTALFLLRCLSQLANASSIIVMWALKPSILELIGVNLQVYEPTLAKNMPYLQYSLLFLLYSHCKCYNHFISTSRLVGNKDKIVNMMTRFSEGLNLNDVPNTSPNSGNFTIILDIIYKTLNVETSTEVTLLILQWLSDILINADIYLESLYNDEYFTKVSNVLVKCGYHFNEQIAIAVSENLDKLLNKKQLSWTNTFLTNITNLCKLHLNSNKIQVRQSYAKLVANIPWDIAIVNLNKQDNCKKYIGNMNYCSLTVYKAQQLHLNGTLYGEMNPMQFKTFMKYLLLLNNDSINLEDLFTSCWNVQSDAKMELFYDLATNSQQVLNNWAALEAAQFCVNYKLRTPLGKPNETFTKIEGALNQIGNDLMKKSQSNELQTLHRVRLLLHFVENLEKAIYNSFEGCAIAMPQPTKQVRSFFLPNMNTCNEWLSRIRIVVMHIALHSNEPNIAVRHGQNLLKEMHNSGKLNTTEFDKVVIFVTLALLNLKESEALIGLYSWCKQSGKRFVWIKYAAEQAAKKYEIAIKGYRKLLDDENDVEVRNFITDQIIVCYKELNNFVDLFIWHKESGDIQQNGRKYWFNLTDWQCNENLFSFEVGNNAFHELSTWDYKKNDLNWSTYQNLTKTESNLYNIAFKFLLENQKSNTILEEIDETMDNIEKSVQNHLESAPNEFLQNYGLLQYVSYGLKHVANNIPSNTVFLVSENFENELNKIDSSVLRKILWWSEYFDRVQNQGFNTFCSNLRLDIIKRARKEKNVTSALNHVYKFFKDKDALLLFAENDYQNNIAKLFTQKVGEITVWSLDMARAIFETIKLSYIDEKNRQDCFNLCASASTAISKYAELFGGGDLRKTSSRILLKLSKWLPMNENVNLTDVNSPLGKFLMVLPEINMMENVDSNVIPLNEMAIGKLLQFSVQQCVSLAKSWNCFGTWCYRWGRKIVDQTSMNNLSEEHCLEVRKLLPADTKEEDIIKIFHILSKTRSVIDDEDIDSNEINTSEMIQNQLQNVDVLRNATEEQLRSLVQIWRNTQKRIYNCYALSADAYFKYLHLVLNSENITKSTEYNTITVTLRLLRLIVKYALELQNILEEGLQTTPTQPWKVIIPQLFSRLNHPECYVRLRVSDLLCRVAEDAPQLITFPAVVGALEGGLKFDFSEITLPKDCLSQNNESIEENELNDEEDNNYDSDIEEEETNTLQTCFKTMVDTLSKQDPETITQVQTLVKELRRITLLWDELWLGTLAQHQSEIVKRQQQLEYEIEKVNENANLTKDEKKSLIEEKHRIIIKPIIFILEQLQDVTSIEAQTPHEKQFQEKYLNSIKDVIEKLKNPENPERPQESLQSLKLLQKKFQQKFHKRASYTLKMQDISPILANMKNTVITMPGLTTLKKTVTISHVSNIVSILPTKTKPKKLIFYGSDGQTYTYLFKGLEDLHLDERIMQFLSITNTMMAQNADPAENNLYRARYYSVIPLGPRSGLISWVDGTMPAFALYKRWQQREIAKPTTKNSTNTVSTNILRPSELFYNKLNPLLREHGVKNIENRKEWPLSVLKKVLAELMNETPNDLLAKELWCNAVSAGKWWQVVKRYSYSVAVMSIIGYIIGLGDRHLDNVLIDLECGDVVHIDYNVCFEKGKTLRVPEKVPFRLTPNMQEALGVTGVEGIFRLACENVLKTMRKGRETLLTLLEAFVYDPLIDWTVSGEVLAGTTFGELANGSNCRQSKKDLEKEITLSMFNVRCMEMKTEWKENKEEILNEIPKLIKCLNSFGLIKQQLCDTEDKLQDLHQQLALVKEAEAQGQNKHSLYLLPSRFESYHKMQLALNTAKQDLDTVITECENHLKVFNDAKIFYDNQQYLQWINELKLIDSNTEESMHIFDLVREFLHNAGKDDIIVQCEQSENDVADLVHHLNALTCKCLQLLQDYFIILSQCPKAFIENHRMNQIMKWCHYLLQNRNIESCELVYNKLKDCLDVNKNNNHQQKLLKLVYNLESLYKDTILQVNKLFEELTTLQSKDSTIALENVYQNAKMGITNFLANERGASSAFEFVIISELVLLNQAFLQLEITAHRSGDWLIKLTSRDGDWFLDDLVMNSCRAVELINNLPINRCCCDDERFVRTVNAIKISNNIYKALHDLNFNFHTIILPEGMKKIQSEDGSVKEMIDELNQIINSIGVPIPEVVIELEKILTCLLMQMDIGVSYELLLDKLSDLKTSFQLLIPPQTEQLSPGKMLLMGFNGLFEKLRQEMSSLVTTLTNLDIPIAWRKLDQVKEAKSISAHIYNASVMKILEDIFFLKKLQAMFDVFKLCKDMCESFKPNDSLIVYNDEQLIKPIRQFIADFISQQLLGVTTENIAYIVCFLLQYLGLDVTHQIEQKDIGAESKVPLDELCQKGWSYLLKNNVFTQNILSQASSLETNLKLAWEKIQEPKKLEHKLNILQSAAIRLQNHLTICNFMYDDLHLHNNSVRGKIIADIKTEMTKLQSVYGKLIEMREKQQQLIENAYQRLNWAKGANPNVVEILAAFETAVSTRNNQLILQQQITTNTINTCNTIFNYELSRSFISNDAKTFNKTFVNSFEKWRMACQYSNANSEVLSTTEESILNLLTPELILKPKWLQIIAEQLTDIIAGTKQQLNDEKEDVFVINDEMISLVDNFKTLYNIHTKLMSDVKSLIKNMTKIDNYNARALDYINVYRDYIECFTNIFNSFKKEINKDEIDNVIDMLNQLKINTEHIYDGLIDLDMRKINRKHLVRQNDIIDNRIVKQESVSKGQQRNAYAVSVWRRVKLKLEGRDPDPGRKYTTQEQVDYVIREATSLDNLALLYEGWTPWV